MHKLRLLLLLLSSLALFGCDSEPPIVEIDTTPIGSGLTTIGIGLVVARPGALLVNRLNPPP
jgi:hypothetical protein